MRFQNRPSWHQLSSDDPFQQLTPQVQNSGSTTKGFGREGEYVTYLFLKWLIKLIISGACEGRAHTVHRKSIELEIQTLRDLPTFQSRFFKAKSDQHRSSKATQPWRTKNLISDLFVEHFTTFPSHFMIIIEDSASEIGKNSIQTLRNGRKF